MSEDPPSPPSPHTRRPGCYRRFWLIALAILSADQASKWWIQYRSDLPHGHFPPYGGWEVVPGYFNIVFTTNTGAAWSLLSGRPMALTVLAMAALLGIFLYRRQLEIHRPARQFAYGLLCGGITGNLVDRLLHGYVVDFLDFHFQFYRWPTFNLADTAIFCGVLLYLIQTWWPASPNTESPPAGQ